MARTLWARPSGRFYGFAKSFGQILFTGRRAILEEKDNLEGQGRTYAVIASNVFGSVKDNRAAVVNVEQLLQVKDLDVVVVGLAANNDVVLEDTDLPPDGGGGTGGLRQTTQVTKLATKDNL